MMNTYRIQLELRSPLGTPLAADTLWGHIAWGIRYSGGEPALLDWLDRYDSDTPPLVISDLLPAGFWPRPAIPRPVAAISVPDKAAAGRRKIAAKRAWISHAAWQNLSSSLSSTSLESALAQDPVPPKPVEVAVLHAAVNRLTSGTAQEGGGTLFPSSVFCYGAAEPPQFEVWAHSTEPTSVIQGWFEAALHAGYGRDAGTGCGQLAVTTVAAQDLPMPPNPNAAILLGPAVPCPSDPANGFFSFGVRCGRVGGDFAIGLLPDGSDQRQKRPVHCLLRGSVLLCSKPSMFVGQSVRGVHRVESIRQYTMAPLLPCTLHSSLLEHPVLQEARS
ncbi:MAG: hypothetical protein ABSH20_19700 [Tepidisphaeraceae bacterium]|jgi:CRISPR-associated protein Csm4